MADYIAENNYAALETINAGEGFWINAKTSFSYRADAGSAVTAATLAPSLIQGWNLVALGDPPQTPAQFNAALGHDLTSLWAWDNKLSRWYFYRPSLEQSGELNSYIDSHLYLDFTRQGKTLGKGTGFWVKKP